MPSNLRTPLIKWMMVRSELRAKVPLALPAARGRVLPDEMDAGAGRRRGMPVAQTRRHTVRLRTVFARPCTHLYPFARCCALAPACALHRPRGIEPSPPIDSGESRFIRRARGREALPRNCSKKFTISGYLTARGERRRGAGLGRRAPKRRRQRQLACVALRHRQSWPNPFNLGPYALRTYR